MKKVNKVWGWEEIIVNEPEYCAKILCINEGASGSLHYHSKKKETFCVIKGSVKVERGGMKFLLNDKSEPITIPPGVAHSIRGTGYDVSRVLEVSTHHSDDDVFRLVESSSG